MKMKKLLSLLLAISMAVSFTACMDNENTTDGSEPNSPTESTQPESGATSEDPNPAERTDEDRFADFKASVTATQAYAGPLTISATMSSSQSYIDPEMDEEEMMGNTMTAKTSFDPASKLSYIIESSESVYGEEKETTVETGKLFKSGDSFYYYDKAVATPASDWNNYESYTKLHSRSSYFEDMKEDADIVYFTEMIIGGAMLADTYAELTSAYSTVYTTALDNFFDQIDEEEFNPSEGDAVAIAPTVTIVEENGSITLNITTTLEITNASEEDPTEIMSAIMNRSCTVTNGKISAVSLTIDAVDNVETSTSQNMEAEMSYSIEYAFDQAGYNAITVTLPAEEEISVEVQDYSTEIVVMFGDIPCNTYISSYADEPSVEDALSYIVSNLESNYELGSWDDNGEYQAVKTLTIEGLYLDKEFTQPLDAANMTEDEYFALETIYAKYTLADGYFMHCNDYKEESMLSKPFQIVALGGLFSSSENDYSYASVDSIESYADGFTFDEGYNGVWVNGVQTTETSFVPESGASYHIVYKMITTDEDITVLDLIGGMVF